MPMPLVTIRVGLFLIALGVLAYVAALVGSGPASFTALIPAFVGVILAILGRLALNPARKALMMHIAVVVAVFALVGGAMRPIRAAADGSLELSLATAVIAIFCLTLLGYIVLSIRSFVAARR